MTRRRVAALALGCALLAGGCGRAAEPEAGPSPSATPTPTGSPTPSATASAAQPPPTVSASPSPTASGSPTPGSSGTPGALAPFESLTITAGGLGSLRAGMTPEQAVATGLVKRVSDPAECAPEYVPAYPMDPGSGEQRFWLQFSAPEDGPRHIVDILIKIPGPRTAKGAGVGSKLDELRAAYGTELVTVGEDIGYGQDAYAITGPAGSAIFLLPADAKGTDAVEAIVVAEASTVEKMRESVMHDGC